MKFHISQVVSNNLPYVKVDISKDFNKTAWDLIRNSIKKIQNSDGEKQKFPLRGLQYYDIFIHPHFRRRISLEKKRSKDGFFYTKKIH